MPNIKQAATEFLANQRIAVTGVSRTPKDHGSNTVYKRLRERGYTVFAVNPNANTVEDDPSYKDLRSIPGGVQAVVIGTRPELAEDTMHQCAELGITQVWMHRGPGAGSVSAAATDYGRRHGICVIDGGCPLIVWAHRRRRAQAHAPRALKSRAQAGVTQPAVGQVTFKRDAKREEQTMETVAKTRKLYRSRTDRKLAGLCGGLAQYLNTDATLIRVLFVVLALLGGPGLVIYLLMWILVPEEPQDAT